MLEVSKHSGEREKSCVEENSPHRKLCFMETLNLTRSPIKKAGLSTAVSHGSVGTAPEDTLSPGPSQTDVDNMHVIDEVNSSEQEADMEEAPQPPGTSPSQSESCGGGTPVPGHHLNPPQPFSDQQPSESLAQDVPAHVQAVSTEDGQKTHTSPDSSSFQAERGDGLGTGQGPRTASSSRTHGSQETEAGCDGGGLGDECVTVAEVCVMNSSPENTGEKKEGGQAPESPLRESSAVTEAPDTAPPQNCPEPSSPATDSIQEKDSDVVSSTISLESLPQEGLSLPDAIYILTQSGEAAADVVSTTNLLGSDATSKISSTTQEVFLPDKTMEPAATPKKGFSPANSSESPGSRPLLHDEDSLMRILSNLKRIPDAISPLRSPIQASKRSHLAAHSKPGHVKSLEKGKDLLLCSCWELGCSHVSAVYVVVTMFVSGFHNDTFKSVLWLTKAS